MQGNDKFPFNSKPDLERISNDQLFEELAKRLNVDVHKLRNKLTVVVCNIQLEGMEVVTP